MGWFDEQIKERRKRDQDNFADAMDEISSVITRKQMGSGARNMEANERSQVEWAVGKILEYYHLKPRDLPENIKSFSDQLEYLCRPYGIMRRTVRLEGDWYKNAVGAYLGTTKDGSKVALIPGRFGGYHYVDAGTGRKVPVNRRVAQQMETEALCFYKPFPMKKLSIPVLMRYILESVPAADYARAMAMIALTTFLGMFAPRITHLLFEKVIPSGSMRLFWAVIVFSVCVSISTQLISTIKTLIDQSIGTQMSISVQAAVMTRVISLSPDFFKKFSAGELTTKIQNFNSLCALLYSGFMVSGVTSVFSLVYITQIFRYARELVIPSLCIIALTLGYSVFNTVIRMNINRKTMKAVEKKNGLTYMLISGIQKIRLSGSEVRAFSRWTKMYTEEVRNTYGIPISVLLSDTVAVAISLAGNLAMYYFAMKAKISVADYYAFTAAYAMVSGAFSALVGIGLQAANIRPVLEQVKPIMETLPEVAEDKTVVTNVSGGMELSHVSFRYDESMPWVLEDLSLKIHPGQYVAIVGKTGCGKSTLVRLLMGFESPQKGAIYYDGKNINTLDLKSLRKKLGVVMQNGKLFQGDIYSNITISAPQLTLEQAWKAAELADIADDIRAMPMGMHTIISEGSGGISGGQKQRLMIARAIAPNPKILIFDEATSALDNITQKRVSQALDGLKCTRIVIAHRLSTIRHCDRIIVLDGGKIVEDGSYDELLGRGGLFTELVSRQQVDTS